MKKRIYIIGKVTGLPVYEVEAKFNKFSELLRAAGFLPINPVEVVNNPSTAWLPAMRKCITALMTADAVFACPDADQSRGAFVEMELCKNLKIPMFVTIAAMQKHFGIYPVDKCEHPTHRRRLSPGGFLNIDIETYICEDCSSELETKHKISR